MTKTEKLYRRIKVNKPVWIFSGYGEVILTKAIVLKKKYVYKSHMSLDVEINDHTETMYISNAQRDLFTTEKSAMEAYKKKLIYLNKCMVYQTNQLKAKILKNKETLTTL